MIKPYNIATTQISDLIFQENLQQTPLKKPAAQSTKNFYLLGIVVGLFAEAVDLLVVLGVRALIAHILGHGSGHVFGDADAAAVEPIAADVAANVEPEENEFGNMSYNTKVKNCIPQTSLDSIRYTPDTDLLECVNCASGSGRDRLGHSSNYFA